MVYLKVICSVSLFLTFCAANPVTKQRPRSLEKNLDWEHDAPTNVPLNIGLPSAVRDKNKCVALAKKSRKSLADRLYLKLRCSKLKLPKLKPPKRPKVPKPTIPKLRPPKRPKVPKPTIPKLKSISPKLVPKVPWVRKKPSPSPRPRKKRTKATARRPTPKPKPKPSAPRASRTPSPRPSPRAPAESVKASLESTKRRLAENIHKRELKAAQQVCRTEDYICGKRCSGRTGPRFLCAYPNNEPKFCERKGVEMGFCEGERGETCVESVLEPAVCERNVTITEYCPGVQGCRARAVEVGRCVPDRRADSCERLRKRRCEYDTRTITAACEPPTAACEDCKSAYRVKTCTQNVTERVEVPCEADGAVAGLPSFEEELRGQGVESRFVRDLVCFDSFFDEAECESAPRVCRLFDEVFDRTLCAKVVCRQCAELLRMHVSEDVKAVCKGLIEGRCAVVGTFGEAVVAVEAGRCFGRRTVQRAAPCYERLPRDQTCERGCVVRACRKQVHEARGFCERNLPGWCWNAGRCRRETREMRDCSGERICEYVVRKRYLCFREKRVAVPCQGGCERETVEKFVCGSHRAEVEGVCREQFEYSCVDVVCSRRVCS